MAISEDTKKLLEGYGIKVGGEVLESPEEFRDSYSALSIYWYTKYKQLKHQYDMEKKLKEGDK